jgi:hypothetical protein
MKASSVFDDRRLDLAGTIGLWSNPEGDLSDQFAIIDDKDLGTHSIVASVNMVARNLGVGKRVRLILEVIE